MAVAQPGPVSGSLLSLAATTFTNLSPTPRSSTSHLTSSTTVAAPATSTTARAPLKPGSDECELLGPFALFIQGALGLLAVLSLVYKRWRERPQRPVKIWAFDASKQVVGSSLLHVANLLMSMLSSGEFKPKADDFQANPCSFYLLNLAIDTTLGIAILIGFLRLITFGFSKTPLGRPQESIQSGNYGRPPKTKWWLKQCFIYFLGLVCMKLCVYVIFQICPWIVKVGDWALRWTEGNEQIQVFFVMLFFPLVMNALQYYIIDSFIKEKTPTDHELLPDEEPAEALEEDLDGSRILGHGEPDRNASDSDDDEVDAIKDDPRLHVIEDANHSLLSDTGSEVGAATGANQPNEQALGLRSGRSSAGH